jgi:hypothetical protein
MIFVWSSLLALCSITKLVSRSFVAVVFAIDSPMRLEFDTLLAWTGKKKQAFHEIEEIQRLGQAVTRKKEELIRRHSITLRSVRKQTLTKMVP